MVCVQSLPILPIVLPLNDPVCDMATPATLWILPFESTGLLVRISYLGGAGFAWFA